MFRRKVLKVFTRKQQKKRKRSREGPKKGPRPKFKLTVESEATGFTLSRSHLYWISSYDNESTMASLAEADAPVSSYVEPSSEEAAAAIAALKTEVKIPELDWAVPAALRVAKWDMDKARLRMTDLASFRNAHPKLFENLQASEFLPQAELGMNSYLPARNTRGELVVLLECKKLNDFVDKKFTHTDMLRFSVFLMMRLMQDPDTQINGVIMLENLDNYPMFAGMRLQGAGFGNMKASFEWLKASPMKLKGIYGFKQPFYLPAMMAMVKPFMSRKLRSRVALYGDNAEDMLTAAGLKPEEVPIAYGGTLENFDPAWYLRSELAAASTNSTNAETRHASEAGAAAVATSAH